jgi:hypothetical protein
MFVFVFLCFVGLYLYKITKPPVWGGQGPYKECRPTDDDGGDWLQMCCIYDMYYCAQHLKSCYVSKGVLRMVIISFLFLFSNFHSVTIYRGCVMAQAVSRRPLTMEAWVCAQVNKCGICGGQSGIGTGFSLSSSVFPRQYHSTITLQTHIIWGMNNMSVSGSSLET